MKVLEIETFGRGGLCHYVFNLAGALAARGHQVDLLTVTDWELRDQLRPPGLTIHQKLARAGQDAGRRRSRLGAVMARKFDVLRAVRDTLRIAKALEPDVIHLHEASGSAVLYLAALKRLGIPLVATVHNVTPHEPVPLQQALSRRIHALPDLLIAHSRVDQKRLQQEFGVPTERCCVIPHGDYGFFSRVEAAEDPRRARGALGVEADAPTALFFGYLRHYKGLDLLLDAWPGIQAQQPAARLLIAGDPVRLSATERQALAERAETLGAICLFDYVPFEEVADWFAAADLLVLPYRHISQSGVLYLALALGVPVVATEVGAWPEMLENGVNALLVPPEDEAALTAAVVRALDDPSLRERLAAGGKALAAAHAWPVVAEKTERAFQALLEC
ncbi:MAG: glycosyltransferase family 4 protein [Xanthomonadales bacterium]|nr:glycosyltransferase family 4 protein [Xanthomonadales bacterium]